MSAVAFVLIIKLQKSGYFDKILGSREHSCRAMLSKGYWKDFTFSPGNHESSIKNFASSFNDQPLEWTWNGTFVPESCAPFPYSRPSIQTCLFSQKTPMIQIMGDSRSRLLYRGLVSLYHGDSEIKDTKVHDDMETYPFKFYWSKTITGLPVEGSDALDCGFRNLLNDFHKAQLTIIGEQVLHPMFEFLLANSERSTDYLMEKMTAYIINTG